MDEIDIYRSARVLVKQHGENAAAEARRMAEAVPEGRAVWERIGAAVDELMATKATDGALFH